MEQFGSFGQEPEGADGAAGAEADDALWEPFEDDAGRQATEQVPPGYQRFEPAQIDETRDLQRRVRYAMAVLCALRSATFALGLARLVAAEALAGNFSGFQGWGVILLATVLYCLAAIGYSRQEGWARVFSVVADTLLILIVVDQVSNARIEGGVVLAILQSVLMPTVSILLAAKAGPGRRRPKVDDWRRDW